MPHSHSTITSVGARHPLPAANPGIRARARLRLQVTAGRYLGCRYTHLLSYNGNFYLPFGNNADVPPHGTSSSSSVSMCVLTTEPDPTLPLRGPVLGHSNAPGTAGYISVAEMRDLVVQELMLRGIGAQFDEDGW